MKTNCPQSFFFHFQPFETTLELATMTSRCQSKHFVDHTLRKFFYWLGSKIGTNPAIFIICPVLVTALLATGFQQVRFKYLFRRYIKFWAEINIWHSYMHWNGWKDSKVFSWSQLKISTLFLRTTRNSRAILQHVSYT